MKYEIFDFKEMEKVLGELASYLKQLNIGDDLVFDSRLITSELVTNVLKHSSGKAYFHGVVKEGFIELEISSDEKYVPPVVSCCSEVFEESGRGLFLVDTYCERRVTTEGGIKVFIKIKE